MQHSAVGDGSFWPEQVVVGEVVYPPGGTFGPRQQRFLQLVLIHTGHMTVWIDGIAQHAQANTVCVLFPGHEERFAFAETCETWHSWLHVTVTHPYEQLLERLKALPWPLQLSPSMNQLMRDALNVQSTPFPTAQELLRALTMQMIWRYIGEGELRMAHTTIPHHPIVEQAQQFIYAHLSEPITLDTIATAVAISPSYLVRLFQAQLRTTPIAYLWQQRIAKGIKLLEQTGLPVNIVAERCGFQSRYHFSRRIRQASGYTPLEIRQRSWQRE